MPTYEVRPGESWASIAGQIFGDQRWLVELANVNGGLSRMLHPGDIIEVPEFNVTQSPYISPDQWAQITGRPPGGGAVPTPRIVPQVQQPGQTRPVYGPQRAPAGNLYAAQLAGTRPAGLAGPTAPGVTPRTINNWRALVSTGREGGLMGTRGLPAPTRLGGRAASPQRMSGFTGGRVIPWSERVGITRPPNQPNPVGRAFGQLGEAVASPAIVREPGTPNPVGRAFGQAWDAAVRAVSSTGRGIARYLGTGVTDLEYARMNAAEREALNTPPPEPEDTDRRPRRTGDLSDDWGGHMTPGNFAFASLYTGIAIFNDYASTGDRNSLPFRMTTRLAAALPWRNTGARSVEEFLRGLGYVETETGKWIRQDPRNVSTRGPGGSGYTYRTSGTRPASGGYPNVRYSYSGGGGYDYGGGYGGYSYSPRGYAASTPLVLWRIGL